MDCFLAGSTVSLKNRNEPKLAILLHSYATVTIHAGLEVKADLATSLDVLSSLR